MREPAKIILSMIIAIIFSFLSKDINFLCFLIDEYVSPFGTIFLNGLKLVSIPIIFSSVILGVSSSERAKFSRISLRAIFFYTKTTIISAIVGVFFANVFSLGKKIPTHIKKDLFDIYSKKSLSISNFEKITFKNFVSNIIPENLFSSFSSNKNLFQIILISILIGFAVLNLPQHKRKNTIAFFEILVDIFSQIIKFFMKIAPFGVFCIVTSFSIEIFSNNSSKEFYKIIFELSKYFIVTLLAMSFMMYIVYPFLIKIFTKESIFNFLKKISQAQIAAISTSSSTATIPVLIKILNEKFNVCPNISKIVAPIGSAINLDGSVVYMGTSIIFISNLLGMDLSFIDQISLILNIIVCSFGISFPSGAIIAITIILQNIGIPASSIVLIMITDRFLDMFRTAVNITSDGAVTLIIDRSEKNK
jgi:Na+/H+-dicarboxylate symporter